MKNSIKISATNVYAFTGGIIADCGRGTVIVEYQNMFFKIPSNTGPQFTPKSHYSKIETDLYIEDGSITVINPSLNPLPAFENITFFYSKPELKRTIDRIFPNQFNWTEHKDSKGQRFYLLLKTDQKIEQLMNDLGKYFLDKVNNCFRKFLLQKNQGLLEELGELTELGLNAAINKTLRLSLYVPYMLQLFLTKNQNALYIFNLFILSEFPNITLNEFEKKIILYYNWIKNKSFTIC